MIRSLLLLPQRKLFEFEGAPTLTAHDRNILRDLVDVLTPFEEATDFVQIDHIPPAGYILPCVRGLQYQLQRMVSKYHSALVFGLKSSFEKRMASYELNETYILAGILDPKFKLRWSSDDIEKQEFLCLLKTAVDKNYAIYNRAK